MPEYTFYCGKCEKKFVEVFSIAEYTRFEKANKIHCSGCGDNKYVVRSYGDDCLNIAGSVKKSDSELKTLGDLARRNTDRMSDDQKITLYQKHNSYKEATPQKDLPKGMSRVKKPPKPKWPT